MYKQQPREARHCLSAERTHDTLSVPSTYRLGLTAGHRHPSSHIRCRSEETDRAGQWGASARRRELELQEWPGRSGAQLCADGRVSCRVLPRAGPGQPTRRPQLPKHPTRYVLTFPNPQGRSVARPPLLLEYIPSAGTGIKTFLTPLPALTNSAIQARWSFGGVFSCTFVFNVSLLLTPFRPPG